MKLLMYLTFGNDSTHVEIYKTLLQQETANHNTFIFVLLTIVIIMLGATWWWNQHGAKQYIEIEVEKKIKVERESLIKELKETIQTEVAEKFKEYEKRLIRIERDVAKSLAFGTFQSKYYDTAIFWWSKVIGAELKLDDKGQAVRLAAGALLGTLLELKKQEDTTNKKAYIPNRDWVIKIINKLPDILNDEKKKILAELKDREDYPED